MNLPNRDRSRHAFHFVRTHAVLSITIFLLAFGVRLLSWHDTRLEVGKVQTAVTADYQRVAQLLRQGGISSFLSSSSPSGDLNNLGHPPGYSILIALVHSVFGQSNTTLQFVQITCDGFAAVIIFLIVAEWFSVSAALIAGLLAAFSPQFAWNSVLLLPDSLAVVPILLAVFCLACAIKCPRLAIFILSGAFIGISCWLRANAMLLTFFFAATVLLLCRRKKRWAYATAIVCGTILVIAPLTLRNAIVFHRFIPLSLGAGQTLLEGIADYDEQGRFGIPKTDMGIMKQEAESFHRPDYYSTLFNPDGVERERWRLARGFGVIRSHPVWFAGVMARRVTMMVRLERARLVSTEPPVSHSLSTLDTLQPAGIWVPSELLAHGQLSPRAKAFPVPEDGTLILMADVEKYGEQFMSASVMLKRNTDYVFTVPIKIEQGRMRISVKDSSGQVYSSAIVEALETKSPDEQPVSPVQLPFVSGANGQVLMAISNEASNPPNPVARIGAIKLFELGPARFLWTRYPRFIVHNLQRLFLTAIVLPLAIIGLVLLAVRRQWPQIIILLVVPVYYFLVQSIVHTEYRYVLTVDYFLLALAAMTLSCVGQVTITRVQFLRPAFARSNR